MAISRSFRNLDRWVLTVSHLVVLVGLGLIAVGAILPWVAKEIPVNVYVLGERTGGERIWVRRLLVVAGVGALFELWRFLTSTRRAFLDVVLVGIGGLLALITVIQSPLTGSWTPGVGVYITLLGSLLVLFGAGAPIVTTQLGSAAGAFRSAGD